LEQDFRELSALEILREMKDSTRMMVGLAYASVLYNNVEIAREVLETEKEIDKLSYELAVKLIVAGKGIKAAQELASLIEVGTAVNMISDSAAEIAHLISIGMPIPDVVKEAFYRSEEVIGMVTVGEGAHIIGKKIGELREEPGILEGCDILAVKRGRWIFDLDPEFTIRKGDILLLEGTREGIEALRGVRVETPPPGEEIKREVKKLRNYLLTLKSISELMVDLAYTAVLLWNKTIAKEIERLEEEVDKLHLEYETYVISALSGIEDSRSIVTLLRLGVSAENIADAAYKMAELVKMGVEPHPIFEEAIERSEETIVKLRVQPWSPAVGLKLYELSLEEETGMKIVAIKRGNLWIYDPKPSIRLGERDLIIAVGPPAGVEAAIKLIGAVEE